MFPALLDPAATLRYLLDERERVVLVRVGAPLEVLAAFQGEPHPDNFYYRQTVLNIHEGNICLDFASWLSIRRSNSSSSPPPLPSPLPPSLAPSCPPSTGELVTLNAFKSANIFRFSSYAAIPTGAILKNFSSCTPLLEVRESTDAALEKNSVAFFYWKILAMLGIGFDSDALSWCSLLALF